MENGNGNNRKQKGPAYDYVPTSVHLQNTFTKQQRFLTSSSYTILITKTSNFMWTPHNTTSRHQIRIKWTKNPQSTLLLLETIILSLCAYKASHICLSSFLITSHNKYFVFYMILRRSKKLFLFQLCVAVLVL